MLRPHRPLRWPHALQRLAVVLPLAVLAALALVGINEASYQRSHQALQQLAHSQATHSSVNRLLQDMLDAETGLRGYLLTGDERYLDPYKAGIATLQDDLEQLRSLVADTPEDRQHYEALARTITTKLSEMALSLDLRRKERQDAWQFVLSTDVGKQHMDAIRLHARALIDSSNAQVARGQAEIERALWGSRLGIALATAVGLLAFYRYLRQTQALQQATAREQQALESERERLEALVRARTASLSALANHLQQVREDERGHLARELHDELGALLTAAKLDLARLKSRIGTSGPEVQERLQHLGATLNQVIALKRRIIEDLRPSALANLGLATALEILAREFSDRVGIDVQTSLETVDLPEVTQLTVYRMVQESLTNIGKYAQAQKVLVKVHQYPVHVAVEIHDDGAGFDPTAIPRTSHGLAGMRQRVEAAGGRLTVTSRAGHGTQISAILPTAPAVSLPSTALPG